MNTAALAADWLRIRASLLAEHPELAEDSQALADTLDGEAGAMDAIASLIRGAREDGASVAALDAMIQDMDARRARLDRRSKKQRASALALMDLIGVSRIVRPDFTASVRATPQKAQVIDEAAVPEPFWRVKREPNLSALREAMLGGVSVPGAVLSNGGQTVAINFK